MKVVNEDFYKKSSVVAEPSLFQLRLECKRTVECSQEKVS